MMQKIRLFAGIILACTITLIRLSKEKTAARDEKNKLKYILQWTSSDTDPFFRMGKGQQQFLKRRCPVNNCFITSNRDELNSIKDFDAILFYGPEFCQKHVTFPTERSKHQKYVFVSRESPAYYSLDSPRYDSLFNWTYTYKLNSDIYFGYFVIKDKDDKIIGPEEDMHWLDVKDMKSIDHDFKNKLKSKRLAAAWFVSNCNTLSRREKIMLKLKKELTMRGLALDIYSDTCSWNGVKSCPKDPELNSAGTECLRKIERDYYFYLSFENSCSEDYVTEKLLHAVQHYTVPIVYGGANYTRFLPDGSYLDAKKLDMKELVWKIIMSLVDKEKYYDFFKWTNHYSYHSTDESPEVDYLCNLCSAINDQIFVKQISEYGNLRRWWNKKF